MTAIKKYRRLESKGFWVETEETHPLDVIVSIGKSSIIISDTNEVPLDHWNFNSIMISDKDEKQTTFSPGQDRILSATDEVLTKPWDKKGYKMPGGAPYHPNGFMTFVGASAMISLIHLRQYRGSWLQLLLKDAP